MSHFYGTIEGQAGEATRRGSKSSGLSIYAAGWDGAIHVRLYELDGKDHFEISQTPWQGVGIYKLIATGILGE